MTNAEYQRNRIAQGPSLLTSLHELIEKHCEEQGLEPVFAMTDALTDIRHLADVYGLDFGEIDGKAYDGYLEELEAAQSPDQV
jgi:hypothetical protein